MQYGATDLDAALQLCESELQRMFLRRLDAELKARKITHNALAKAIVLIRPEVLELAQTSISRILRGKQDPTLGKIHAISRALDIPAWTLLTDQYSVEQRTFHPKPVSNVRKLPTPPRWADYQKREKIARKK